MDRSYNDTVIDGCLRAAPDVWLTDPLLAAARPGMVPRAHRTANKWNWLADTTVELEMLWRPAPKPEPAALRQLQLLVRQQPLREQHPREAADVDDQGQHRQHKCQAADQVRSVASLQDGENEGRQRGQERCQLELVGISAQSIQNAYGVEVGRVGPQPGPRPPIERCDARAEDGHPQGNAGEYGDSTCFFELDLGHTRGRHHSAVVSTNQS